MHNHYPNPPETNGKEPELQPGEFGQRRVVAKTNSDENQDYQEYDAFGRTESGTYLALNAGELAVAHKISQEKGGRPAGFLAPHRISPANIQSIYELDDQGELIQSSSKPSTHNN